MSVRTYNPSVRVGNWNEDIQLEEDTLKDFLERKEKGQLLIQQSGDEFQLALSKVDLSISRDGCVHYGDVLKLVNPAAKDQTKYSVGDVPRQESAISINKTGVTGSKHTDPCARNTFMIVGLDGSKNGDCLTYGTPFSLVTAKGGMFLQSDHANFQKSSRKSRHQEITLAEEPSKLTAWMVQPEDPLSRFELQNCPVPANEIVIISHCYTNRHLCVEQNCTIRSPFGCEYEVSAHYSLDSHKAEKDIHHWIMTLSVPGSDIMSVKPPQENLQSATGST